MNVCENEVSGEVLTLFLSPARLVGVCARCGFFRKRAWSRGLEPGPGAGDGLWLPEPSLCPPEAKLCTAASRVWINVVRRTVALRARRM